MWEDLIINYSLSVLTASCLKLLIRTQSNSETKRISTISNTVVSAWLVTNYLVSASVDSDNCGLSSILDQDAPLKIVLFPSLSHLLGSRRNCVSSKPKDGSWTMNFLTKFKGNPSNSC